MIKKFKKISCVLGLFFCFLLPSKVFCNKYKICVVDGKGGFKRSTRYCPLLDTAESQVECVLGVDRYNIQSVQLPWKHRNIISATYMSVKLRYQGLDCLRRISKGKADFAVLTPEDLITAANSEIEVLITNELRYTKDDYEYEIVAVISNSAGISSRHDIKGKKFCHPGYGYETDWTKILSNYLEALTVPQSCLPQYTITENRIRASSEFFESACKAGPWVNRPNQDAELKQKYPNLCELCDNPSKCSIQDKYWGRRGSLFCLTDGAGDISWARLDDVKIHFGLFPGGAQASLNDYSLLCPDGRVIPINSTNPCVWVVKPWPVIASQRTKAQDIQEFLSTLSSKDNYNWQSALLGLIQIYHLSIHPVDPLSSIESYLDRAKGFLNANSFTGCHPPRTIRICTVSVSENAKCAWLRESIAVYGVEPDIDCILARNTSHCMQAVKSNVADVVMVSPDMVHTAMKTFNLKPLFYETVNDDEKYITVAVTKNGSSIKHFGDLKNKKACFPVYDGVAWNSVQNYLHSKKLLDACSKLSDYFGPSCVPKLPQKQSENLKSICKENIFDGEYGALRCLLSGNGEVAFVSKNSVYSFIKDFNDHNNDEIKIDQFQVLCDSPKRDACHFSWAPLGYGMVRQNNSALWAKDTVDVFLQINNLFGKDYKSLTTPLQLFGPFDGKSNILFHDATIRLRSVPTSRNIDKMVDTYEDVLENAKRCLSNANFKSPYVYLLFVFSIFGYIFS